MTITLVLVNRPLKNGKCNIVFDVVNGRALRKKIITGIKVIPNDWDSKHFRVKKSDKDSKHLNHRLKELTDKLYTALAKYDSTQFTQSQVISFLEGKTAFGCIDDYIETEIKNTRTSATYIDYKNAFNSLKLHTGFKSKLMFEDVNYSLLDKFKRKALSKGLSGASINSYFNKIRAVMNDAFDKGLTYEKFELNKKLRVPTRRTVIKTISPEDFKNAIDKIQTIRDWQALAFYLLMFSTRGMYPADIVGFSSNKLKDKNFENEGVDSHSLIVNGYDYLIHRRSKTRNKANEDMAIIINSFDSGLLIEMLKRSVIYTHYNKNPEIIPSIEDRLSIFDYDVDKDYKLHSDIWDYYTKRVKKLLGYSYKTARKTFNTIALELKVSDTIRRVLLGHADSTMLSHYDNFNTKEVVKQVEDAHASVLATFNTQHLTMLLRQKLLLLNVSNWVKDEPYYDDENDFWKMVKKDLKGV